MTNPPHAPSIAAPTVKSTRAANPVAQTELHPGSEKW
ncbi:hypothetical protein BJY26_003599 [Spelaeicoccus albus]|uniref:Uncharacterized protein n=1 Tax=Spelaeicoccus albus TaxID=1280376 RepID=A0A7Z0D5M3_9MICO|nr:hypothetical protein [Spelaeicoccus albus]